MPSEKVDNTSSEAVGNPLSSLDSKIINAILKHCMENAKPTAVKWENVRKELDFKTVEVTRERFRQLCKKHHWFEGSKDNDDPSTPSPSPKKRAPGQCDTPLLPKENGFASPATSGWEADVNSPVSAKKRKFNKMERAPKAKAQQKATKGNAANKKRCARPKHEASDSDEA